MIEIVSKITQFFPKLAVLTNFTLVIFLILQISDDFGKIMNFLNKVFDFRKHVDTLFYAKKRKKYNKVLYSNDFLNWQTKVMEIIYTPLIAEINNEFEKSDQTSIGFTNIFFENSTKKPIKYESVTLKMKPVEFPFGGVCSKKNLERKKDISQEKYKEIQKKHKWMVRKYYRLIGQTIRYPKRMGYMLDDLVLGNENEDWYVTAYCGNYENNLKTSHILEYELYELYKKNKRYKWKIETKNRNTILKKLPIRNEIHQYFINMGKENRILLSGRGRSSLLGVQIFVIVKNCSGKYDALRIRRSENVAAKPGFLQFVPSGGFEAMNDCVDYDSQWDNYSISKAVFRELLEECFGQDEDDKKAVENNVSPDKIYGNPHIKNILHKLNDKNDGSRMQLLGSAMSLVGLRHELSFILKVDDPELSTSFISNYESKTAIHMIDIEMLEQGDFWMEDDIKKLNCTSAALFELARQSEVYQNCLHTD